MHHLCIVFFFHHPKSSLPPSPFIRLYPFLAAPIPFPLVITVLLSPSVWGFGFVCLCVCLFNPFTFFTQPHNPPPLTAVSLSVSMSLFLFCLVLYFVHEIPHISKIISCLFFSDWLISIVKSVWIPLRIPWKIEKFYIGSISHKPSQGIATLAQQFYFFVWHFFIHSFFHWFIFLPYSRKYFLW